MLPDPLVRVDAPTAQRLTAILRAAQLGTAPAEPWWRRWRAGLVVGAVLPWLLLAAELLWWRWRR